MNSEGYLSGPVAIKRQPIVTQSHSPLTLSPVSPIGYTQPEVEAKGAIAVVTEVSPPGAQGRVKG